ncbi:MAG: PAS domain S-box protein [Deferribacteres bacterium]|nr:PAS domain S-box protein [candidate division KSB1 bacterium]MCB9504131.1 PAS domain S-box protein [Deferribacteres bacterium]
METNTEQTLVNQSRLFEIVPIQIWYFSKSDTYAKVNQRHADFIGRNQEEMKDRKLQEILPVEKALECQRLNQKVFESGEPLETEEWVTTADGKKAFLKITRIPLFDETGQIEVVACFGIDITDQKNVETELSQSEENFRNFIETIDDIVLVGNPEGRILYSNPAATLKLGYTQKELGKKQIIDLHPGYLQKEATLILTDMFNGKRDVCPLPLISKNGNLIPVETRIWFGEWNGLNCIFGLSKDIRREQEALQKFDRFFRMNPSPMAVSKIPDQLFLDINDAFTKVIGYTRDEIVGKSSDEFNLFINEKEQQKVAELLTEFGQIRELELEVKTKNGDILHGLFSGELIESQGTSYFLTVMIDITGRKQAEKELQKSLQELSIAFSEIKTLRGIVPICSRCKNIRDDKGYWNKVEAYISKHTEARFSHSICPECMATLYPDYCEE